MIFFTVGTNQYRFSRLIREGIKLSRRFPKKRFVIQSGTYKPGTIIAKNVKMSQHFSYQKVQKLIKESELLVCHAGSGTIMQAHMFNKKPLVIPRLSRFKEHINDHQSEFAQFLFAKKLIFLEEDPRKIDKYLGVNAHLTNIKSERREKLINTLCKNIY